MVVVRWICDMSMSFRSLTLTGLAALSLAARSTTGERVSGVGVGAVSGGAGGGPAGAVVGGIVGGVTGPAVATSMGALIATTITITTTIVIINDRRGAALRGFFRVTLAAGVGHVSIRNHPGRPVDPATLWRTRRRQRRPLLGIRLRFWPRRNRPAWHHPDCPHCPVAHGPPLASRAGIAHAAVVHYDDDGCLRQVLRAHGGYHGGYHGGAHHGGHWRR